MVPIIVVGILLPDDLSCFAANMEHASHFNWESCTDLSLRSPVSMAIWDVSIV